MMASSKELAQTSNGMAEYFATAQAVRQFTREPIPRHVLEYVVWAATRSPSPANSQPWRFVVVEDRAAKEAVRDAILPKMRARRESTDPLMQTAGGNMLSKVDNLVENLADVPALIFCCGDSDGLGPAGGQRMLWSALYPAIGFLLIAARSVGLGSTLTMLHLLAQREVREIVGVPSTIEIAGLVVVGWPTQPFTAVKRRPLTEVLCWDRWS
jgi:nitroreductase